jgi:hypothetical protein
MAYKVFTIGEEALAADVNTLLMSQTVSRFPSAATRAVELTGPVVNQLTMTDDRPGQIQYWNGAAWVDLRDPTFHQFGHYVATTDAYGSLSIPFPTAFADANYVAHGTNGDANALVPSQSFWVGIVAVGMTTSYFTVSLTWVNPAGSAVPLANVMVHIDWLAIGRRP